MYQKGFKKTIEVINQLKNHKGQYYEKWLINYYNGIKRWQMRQSKNYQRLLKESKKSLKRSRKRKRKNNH